MRLGYSHHLDSGMMGTLASYPGSSPFFCTGRSLGTRLKYPSSHCPDGGCRNHMGVVHSNCKSAVGATQSQTCTTSLECVCKTQSEVTNMHLNMTGKCYRLYMQSCCNHGQLRCQTQTGSSMKKMECDTVIKRPVCWCPLCEPIKSLYAVGTAT